jgi:hypothetical protein
LHVWNKRDFVTALNSPNKQMVECPSVSTLNDLLNETLREADRLRVIAHVEECAACRDLLHQLSSDTPWLSPKLVVALSEASDATAHDLPPGSEGFITRLKRELLLESGSEATIFPKREHGGDIPAVDGYDVLAEIGRGAAGVVYRARHLKLNRMVALKVIHAAASMSPELRQRFSVEARAAARLRHPNIVEVYDVGEQNGCPFLSLELVEGETLARRLGRGGIAARQIARLMERMARAIEYAHCQGVIHRDLKPANVLLGVSGLESPI